MPFLDTSSLKVVERLPGWKGRFFHTTTMTVADYESWQVRRFTSTSTQGGSVRSHRELEVTVDAITQVVRPGIVAIVPSNAHHSVRARPTGASSSSITRRGQSSDRGRVRPSEESHPPLNLASETQIALHGCIVRDQEFWTASASSAQPSVGNG